MTSMNQAPWSVRPTRDKPQTLDSNFVSMDNGRNARSGPSSSSVSPTARPTSTRGTGSIAPVKNPRSPLFQTPNNRQMSTPPNQQFREKPRSVGSVKTVPIRGGSNFSKSLPFKKNRPSSQTSINSTASSSEMQRFSSKKSVGQYSTGRSRSRPLPKGHGPSTTSNRDNISSSKTTDYNQNQPVHPDVFQGLPQRLYSKLKDLGLTEEIVNITGSRKEVLKRLKEAHAIVRETNTENLYVVISLFNNHRFIVCRYNLNWMCWESTRRKSVHNFRNGNMSFTNYFKRKVRSRKIVIFNADEKRSKVHKGISNSRWVFPMDKSVNKLYKLVFHCLPYTNSV